MRAGLLALVLASATAPALRSHRQGTAPPPGIDVAAVYAQHCAACHGKALEGGAASSLVDDRWIHGGDDGSIAATIRDGRNGTPMAAFRDVLTPAQIRELVFFIREQAGIAKGRPALKTDPDGTVVRSEKQVFRLEVVAKGLETPWGLAFLPDGRLLITERPGRLRIVENGRLLPAVSGIPAVWTVQDGGLFDVEVHPQYAQNGWIYLSYSEPAHGGSMTVVIRGRIRANAWVDQQVLFKAPAEYYTARNYHYGLRFLFAPDGRLFYSIGDKGNPPDSQDLSRPTGKIHRVNDDGSPATDNPFVGSTGAVASVWSFGHRNPQGFAFDPRTGQLWSSEHGPRGGDELNRIERGGNYGWPLASHGLEPGVTTSEHPGTIQPVVHWTPTVAPSGMTFYDGKRYRQWRNSLFVACLGGQQLRRVEIRGDRVTHQEVVFNEFGRVRDIVTGPDDLFYVALSLPGAYGWDTTAGAIVRLVPVE